MKAIIFSDSHSSIHNMQIALNKFYEQIDVIIHLGDYVDDAEEISRQFPDCRLFNVSGNCDYNAMLPSTLVVSINGINVLLSHGHHYNVKSGINNIYYTALEQNARLCLFGHTHQIFCEKTDEMLILNPGSISKPRNALYPSFVIVNIGEDLEYKFFYVKANEIILIDV